jgi:hypothetical protein
MMNNVNKQCWYHLVWNFECAVSCINVTNNKPQCHSHHIQRLQFDALDVILKNNFSQVIFWSHNCEQFCFRNIYI